MFTTPARASARGARRRIAVPLLLAAPLALAALPSAAQAGSARLTTVGCGGEGGVSANEWTVPAGVTSIRITAHGERGGGTFGGQGAFLYGDLSVAPGGVLYACVGVGGGAAGTGPNGAGFAGGGLTSVSIWPDNSSPLVVAAGGGASGAVVGGSMPGVGGAAGTTGDGGGGTVARWVNESNMPSNGGTGATLSPAAPGTGGANPANVPAVGGNGSARTGGAGGAGASVGGGGGGAGVQGGGGGAGSMALSGGEAAGGGGGGGTSSCALTDCRFAVAGGAAYLDISWVDPPATTTTTASLSVARPTSQQLVTYRAVVAPQPSGGTVAFRVDGVTVNGCDAQPVVAGAAECETWVPGASADYELTTTYSGTTGFEGSEGRTTFHVHAGRITATPSPTAEFGEVELGESATRQITVRNEGDGDVQIDGIAGIRISEYQPDEPEENRTDYTAVDDQCTDRTLAPGAACVVTVKFIPTALGERLAQFRVNSDAWSGSGRVLLSGTGVEQVIEPEPRPQDPQPEQPKPEQPKPQTPVTPAPPPAGTPPAPAPPVTAPAPPAASRDTLPPVVGASANVSASKPPVVSSKNTVKLPLVCPVGQPCSVSGTLTLALGGGQARASQASKVRVLARFSGIRIAAGRTRNLSLRLPAAFVKEQQAKGVRVLRTTLTVRTTLGSGQTVTRRQAVTIRIPVASVAQRRAAPTPEPAQAPRRPSFTG